jgi:hypothetical protein
MERRGTPTQGETKMTNTAADFITSYMTKNPGSTPNYKTIEKATGVAYSAASEIFDNLIDAGRLVKGTKLSATGRRMQVMFTAEMAHLSAS